MERKPYLRQKAFKVTDHYPITDATGTPFFQVDEEFRFFKKKFWVTSPDGSLAFTIEKQIAFPRERFVVTFPNGDELQIQSRITFWKKKIDIGPASSGLVLVGDFGDHHFSLYKAGQLIAEIRRQWLSWGDCYELAFERQ